MTELIPTINEIVKYGLMPDMTDASKEKLLEKSLVKIYNLSFYIQFEFDETCYADFDKSTLPDIRKKYRKQL